MEIIKNFENNKIRIIDHEHKIFFVAKDVAQALGYKDTAKAITDHVWEKNKMQCIDLNKVGESPTLNLHPQTIILFEAGVYQLIFSSKLDSAERFQEWVFSEVLPSIRKNGLYQFPKLIHNQLLILNENDLHIKVVSYIRKHYIDLVFNAPCGELQDTSSKRIEAWKKGYTAGITDLLIFDPNKYFNGFAIEFKNPNGKGILSNKQSIMISNLKITGWKVLVSDDYDNIIHEIEIYLRDRRICCEYCIRKFKNKDTINNHYLYFHRISK